MFYNIDNIYVSNLVLYHHIQLFPLHTERPRQNLSSYFHGVQNLNCKYDEEDLLSS
jgi:hypothetical protein